MIIHWLAQLVLGPNHRVGIGTFTCKIQSAQARDVVFGDLLALGVFAFDGADRGGGGKETADVMFGYDTPEGAGIRGSDGFALEYHGRIAVDQGAIADIAVPDDPAHI